MTFCGWNTEQTYCLAKTIDQNPEIETQALGIIRANPNYPKIAELFLQDLCKKYVDLIFNNAPHLWRDGKTLDNSVDWTQVRDHFEIKLNM